jgi:hypothetical protein
VDIVEVWSQDSGLCKKCKVLFGWELCFCVISKSMTIRNVTQPQEMKQKQVPSTP